MNSSHSSAGIDEQLIDAARRQFEAAHRRVLERQTRIRASTMPGRAAARFATAPDDLPGYQITEEIHRGGQGVVYRGVHVVTRREVAIKVLHGGRFASAHERARFEREARILAQLRHPNVVTVHDSGVAGGHAYIVMDYIAGAPLDEYVRSVREELPLRALLEKFGTICDAVQAAHVRGITHRDLKPANIRVDEHGQPHVLDFGLAKLTEPDPAPGSSDLTMTQAGQFVGSLPWAAPEQAAGESDRIDLRTDVYALGVILYQIITGVFPYPLTGSPRTILDHILRTEPLPPRSVRRDLPEDVETITLKCLQKQPERRYQTAGEVGRDIRHYLADEPIDARRDSVAYVLRKQLRRHRLPVAIASAFALVIVAGLATSAVLWRQAVGQRDAAQTARDNEAEQRRLADASASRARTEAAKAQAVTGFLQDMLESIDPAKARGRDVTVREVLDAAASRVDEADPANEPEVAAQVRLTIGSTYLALGRYADAEAMLGAAAQLADAQLGAKHPLTLRARTNLGNVLFHQGRYADAEQAYRDLQGDLEATFGPDDVTLLGVLRGLGFAVAEQGRQKEAQEILRPVLDRCQSALGMQHLTTLQTADTLGVVLREAEKLDEAESLQRSAVEGLLATLGEDHPTTLAAMNNYAVTLRMMGRYPDAEVWLRRALDVGTRVLSEEHPQTLKAVTNLGAVLWYQAKRDEAIDLGRRAVAITRRVLAPGHPQVLTTEDNLARMLKGLGRNEELSQFLGELITGRRDTLGEGHPETILVEDYQRDVLGTLGRADELRSFTSDVLARWKAIAAAPDVASAHLKHYAELLLSCDPEDLRDPAAALEVAQRAVAADRSAANLQTLAAAYRVNGDYQHAVEAQRAALDAPQNAGGPRRVVLEETLADLLRAGGDRTAAEEWLRTLVARRKERSPDGGQDVELALSRLGDVLIDEQKPADAELVLRECLAFRRDRLPAGHMLIAAAMSQLGDALLQQGRVEEAEPLLLESARRLQDDTDASEARRREARARVARLYELTGRAELAGSWID